MTSYLISSSYREFPILLVSTFPASLVARVGEGALCFTHKGLLTPGYGVAVILAAEFHGQPSSSDRDTSFSDLRGGDSVWDCSPAGVSWAIITGDAVFIISLWAFSEMVWAICNYLLDWFSVLPTMMDAVTHQTQFTGSNK